MIHKFRKKAKIICNPGYDNFTRRDTKYKVQKTIHSIKATVCSIYDTVHTINDTFGIFKYNFRRRKKCLFYLIKNLLVRIFNSLICHTSMDLFVTEK